MLAALAEHMQCGGATSPVRCPQHARTCQPRQGTRREQGLLAARLLQVGAHQRRRQRRADLQ
jgi:hypothetical protein